MLHSLNSQSNGSLQPRRTHSDNYTQPRTGSKEWFDESVRKGAVQPFAAIVTVSPELAEYILLKNDGNRNRPEKNVIRIATDIKGGLWELNGETIIISDDGFLNDGQHRLQAVVLADQPVQVLMFFGAARKSRFTVDMGTARTCGHLMSMDGVADANVIAASSKLLLLYLRGAYTHADHVAGTKQEIRAFFEQNRESIERAHAAVAYSHFGKAGGRTFLIAGYAILFDKNQAACEEFFGKLIDGAGLEKGCPILQARNHFLSASKERLLAWEKLELLLRYWNAWRRGTIQNRNLFNKREWPTIEG